MRRDHTSEEEIRAGATLLLQINRNHFLYQQINRTPKRMLKKLEYEISKHINIRLEGYTLNDVVKMEQEVLPPVETAVKVCNVENEIPHFEEPENVKSLGMRPDHDSLPEDIQAIWPKNAERWKRMKETYEMLKTLDAPCDRFEYVKLLKELWYSYREDMNRYDDFKASDEQPVDDGHKLNEEEQKKVDQAQSYISRFLPKLIEIIADSKEDDFPAEEAAHLEDLRGKIQKRVDILLTSGIQISEDRLQQLIAADIRVTLEKADENEEQVPEGQEKSDEGNQESAEAAPAAGEQPAEQPGDAPESEQVNTDSDAEGERPE